MVNVRTMRDLTRGNIWMQSPRYKHSNPLKFIGTSTGDSVLLKLALKLPTGNGSHGSTQKSR